MACDVKGPLSKLATRLGIYMDDNEQTRRKILATYDYRDGHGDLLYQVVRYEPKRFAQRRPDGQGGWIWNLKGVRRVLYRLPELVAASPGITVYVPEGEKAVEALRSVGLIATCNSGGAGKWPFDASALAGRKVVFLPANDDAGQRHVQSEAREVYVVAAEIKVVELPGLPDKGDVVDWIGAGHTVDELRKLMEMASPWEPDQQQENHEEDLTEDCGFKATEQGLFWLKPTREGVVPVQLTNFNARIAAEVVQDDGVEARLSLELETNLRGHTSRFTIQASQLGAMSWVLENLGATAILSPGLGLKDHARAAIQFLSDDVVRRRIFAHTGWRYIDGHWVYLHSGGAIGPVGPDTNIEVALPDALEVFELPDSHSGPELTAAVRASLRALDVAADTVTVPILSAVWRAVLGGTDFTIHLSGETGCGKSELAALAQQHYGADMNSRRLPGSWSSTGNSLEVLAFSAKDALLVVDDFAPTGTGNEISRYHREADRLLRAQGNRSARQQLRPDATLKPAKPPRGTIVSTGEDVPKGQSLKARLLATELPRQGPDTVDWQMLTACQRDTAKGLYAQAMAGFLRWLAPRYDIVMAGLREAVAALRDPSLQGRRMICAGSAVAARPKSNRAGGGALPTPALHQLSVRPVPFSVAKRMLEREHYLHSFPGGTVLAFSVFYGSHLTGALTLGAGPAHAYWLVADAASKDCCALSRFWLDGSLPKNTASRILAVVTRLIRRPTTLKFLITYADPAHGHTGTIYQATNWLYTGLSDATPLYDLGDGRPVHSRTLSQILGTHSGAHFAKARIIVERVAVAAKHRYIFFLDATWRAKLLASVLPYSKAATLSCG